MFSISQPLSRSDAALRGGVALVLGVVFLIWPGITIGTALALFAIFCFVDAAVALVRLFSSGQSAGDRVLQILRVVLDVLAAIVVIAWPGPSAQVLAVVIGIYAVIAGVFELMASGSVSRAAGVQGSGWLVLSGILAIIAGVLLIFWPNVGAVSLAIVFGVYLAAYGTVMLISAASAPKGGTVPDVA